MTPQHLGVTAIFTTLFVIVNCQNRAPLWEETLESILSSGIAENTRVGSELGVLRARDPEGGAVYFTTESEYFRVGEESGQVTLEKSLQGASSVSLTFYVSDSEGNRELTSYMVPVIDSNDSAPEFLETPYSTSFAENLAEGASVFEFQVRDSDRGANAEITIECVTADQEARAACEAFSLTSSVISAGLYRVRVTARRSLDYEEKRRYLMSIAARDNSATGVAQRSLTTLTIEITDVQDSQARFLNVPLSMIVYEHMLENTIAGEIQARDSDEGSPNPLLIRIAEDRLDYFVLDATVDQGNGIYKAVIRSTGKIDRETLDSNYQFRVEAVELISGVESDIRTQTTVTVTVRDINDNAPVFNQESYSITVPEGLPRNTDLPGLNMVVSDDDLDENSYFELEIISGSSLYSLSPTSGTGSVAVALVVKEPQNLDYERAEFRTQVLTIRAKETQTIEQKSSTATVTVMLEDMNDNSPAFSQNEYSATVREDRPVGFQVITIIAVDMDSGDYGKIKYSLKGTDKDVFEVNENTGEIRLARELDYETQEVISLAYEATDGGDKVTSVPLRVQVLDANDQGPIFELDQYNTLVLESKTVLDPNVTVKATEQESDRVVTYRIVRGNTPDDAFRVNPETGFVFLTRTVDYDETPDKKGFFTLIIEASDHGTPPQTSETTVSVGVRDENNHGPLFWRDLYRETIEENTPMGTSILTVNATDADSGLNGEIGYVIQSGSKDNFIVDYFTGVVTVSESADLTIERFGSLYNMLVHAVDKGSPQKTGTAQVVIAITDSNNQPPRYSQDTYLFTVYDTVKVGTQVSSVKATDQDVGSVIEYSIVRSSIVAADKNKNDVNEATFNFRDAFVIDRFTGIISTNLPLNREKAAEISFDVQAKDVSAQNPEEQTALTKVIIIIRSPDDDSPSFDTQEMILSISEEEPVRTRITTIVATDPQNNNDQITDFRKVDGSDKGDYFSVARTTGEILLNKRLDFESLPGQQLTFQVEAFTNPPDVRSAMATIIVLVQDINDHDPKFLQGEYVFNIPESSQFPKLLGIIVATDEDSGSFGKVNYSLSGQGFENFRIDPSSGYMYVAEGVLLDREITPQYNLIVTATDNIDSEGVKRTTSVPLTINLLDENDNLPTFKEPFYDILILENVGTQTSIGRVEASDKDDGNNAVITYSVSGPDYGLFYVETTTGIVRTRRNLMGYSSDEPYVLTVTARDGGSPTRQADTTVTIVVNSAQTDDGKPILLYPPTDGTEVTIPENDFPGTNVTQIRAEPGSGGGKVTYGFLENEALRRDHDKFNIDPETGMITLKESLDREAQETYTLVVTVRGEDGLFTQRRIIIRLTDLNDNSPSFYNCPDVPLTNPIRASVAEQQPPNVFVTQVKACDSDNAPNNQLYYFIVCGNRKSSIYGGVAPFRIEPTTGRIFTNAELDREVKPKFTLCIYATNEEEPNITETSVSRKKRQTDLITPETQSPNVITVEITLEDIDDNGPEFKDAKITRGVLATANLATEVVQVQAVDLDDGVLSSTKYRLENLKYVDKDDDISTPDPKPFVIDEDTGMITTNLGSYLDYVDGYFTGHVVAQDSRERDTRADISLYVVRENQLLRFIFDAPPQEMQELNLFETYVQSVDTLVTKAMIIADVYRYHINQRNDEGKSENDYSKTDLCFHMVKDDKIVNVDEALGIWAAAVENNGPLEDLNERHSMEDVNRCNLKTTTKWWPNKHQDWWWLWWILVVFAILIFIIALILILVIYCYWWPKYREHLRYAAKPYVILDQPAVLSVPSHPTSEYEWQEEIVKMD